MNLSERIKQLIEKLEDTPASFAKRTKNKPNNIYNAIKGEFKPSTDVILNILENVDRLNSNWLLLGKGQMFESAVNPDENGNILEPEEKYFSSNNSNEQLSATAKSFEDALIKLRLCEMDKDLLKNENVALREKMETLIRHQIKH